MYKKKKNFVLYSSHFFFTKLYVYQRCIKFILFVRVPVNVIEHDHLDVPSIVACLACSKESM